MYTDILRRTIWWDLEFFLLPELPPAYFLMLSLLGWHHERPPPIPQTFFEHLVYARHCVRHWRWVGILIACEMGITSLVGTL